MKFILVVLLIHFAIELIGNRKKIKNVDLVDDESEDVRHPAEFDVRQID